MRKFTVLLGVTLLTVSFMFFLRPATQAAGICSIDGKRRTEAAKIKAALNTLNSRYYLSLGTGLDIKSGIYSIIPYKNVDEIIRSNPGCCRVGQVASSDGRIRDSYSDKFLFGFSDIVYVSYNVRIRDSKGLIRSIERSFNVPVNACAKVVRMEN